MGNLTDLSSFEFVFTRCEGRNSKASLAEMIAMTTPEAISIDPMDYEAASDILKELWCDKPRLMNPAECFADFISQSSSDKLKLQVTRMFEPLKQALTAEAYEVAGRTLVQLSRLAQAVPLTETKDALEQYSSKIASFVNQLGAEADMLVKEALATTDFGEYRSSFRILVSSFWPSRGRKKCARNRLPSKAYLDKILKS
eukprot:scaffold5479_cov199-Amphora_coffeaeformis.AAC.78